MPALATARGARRCGTQLRRCLHQAGPGARYAALCRWSKIRSLPSGGIMP